MFAVVLLNLFSSYTRHLQHIHSFPTRRSSDLGDILAARSRIAGGIFETACVESIPLSELCEARVFCKLEYIDRKSTRLNSSHRCISYAVFCLKKKKRNKDNCYINN